MSLLLEMHTSSIPSSYMALFPHLLQPVLWERTGNIPPLVRLLQAYLEKGGASIASSAADKIVSGGSVVNSRESCNVLVVCSASFIHCTTSMLTLLSCLAHLSLSARLARSFPEAYCL